MVSIYSKIPAGESIPRTYGYIYKGTLNSNGDPQFTPDCIPIDLGYDLSWNDWLWQKGSPSVIDIEGDGTNEVLIPTAILSSANKYIQFDFFDGFPEYLHYGYYLTKSDKMPVYTTGDFDNDGKGDLIFMEKGHTYNLYPCEIVKYNIKTKSFENFSFNLSLNALNKIPEKMFASDFDGDGLTDVMVFYAGGYTIYWNMGNGVSAQTFSDGNKTVGSNIGNNKMIRQGDFNGDGLTDFIMNESNDHNWYFAFYNGDGTFTKQLACTLEIYDQSVTEYDDDKFDCEVFDFDLDGKSDVIIHKAMYYDASGSWQQSYYRYSNTQTCWMRSTGTALAIVSGATSNNEPNALSKYLVTGDFNGDGKTELMNYGYNIYDGSDTTQKWRLYRNPGVVAGTDMLASVTSGYGSTTNISYAPLTNNSVYTKGSDATVYPVINITPPMAVVKSVVYDNGIAAGKVTENYKYSGAKVHLQGKGFLGLKSMTTTNVTTGVITEGGFNTLDITYFGPLETYSKTIIGADTSKTTVNYTIFAKGAKKYFAYPNKKTVIDMDNNIDSTTYHYNTTYGYINDEKTVFGNTNMYKTTKYENYTLAGGRYQPQLITSISKHLNDNQPFTRKTSLTYYTDKGYPLTKVENSGTELALTTEYTSYDDFGNLKEYKVSGSGDSLITYKTEYDPTYRFVSKKLTLPVSTQTSYLYDLWGNVTSETDETNSANLLTTSQTYDRWGQKTSITMSDGRKTTYKTGWNKNDANKKYFTLTQGKSQPWVKTWYDTTGRETSSESIGPMNMVLGTSKTYNAKGELKNIWSGQGYLSTSENYSYDPRGRLLTKNTINGQSIAYSYGNRTVTTTTNRHTTTKTFDAWGGIKSVDDPLSGNVAYTYKSVGKPGAINANGAISTMDYDQAGNQKMLFDPNAGTINYTYDAAGRVKKQVDNKGDSLLVVYDKLGRMTTSTLKGIPTNYTYGTTGFDFNRLTKVLTGNNSANYTYDKYGRQLTEKRLIYGAGSVDFAFSYNTDGQLQTTTYPGGVQVSREYDAYGNQVKVLAAGQTVWELTGTDGMETTTRLGGFMTATRTLNYQGLLTNLKTMKDSTVLRDMGYQFDEATGNLTWRTGMTNQKENFEYDLLDRLKSVKEGVAEVETMAIGFEPNGNILSKTGLGTYVYDVFKPHAVALVDYNMNLMPSAPQSISYTAFNKAECLKDKVGATGYQLDIMYGPDEQRWKSVLKKNGTDVKTNDPVLGRFLSPDNYVQEGDNSQSFNRYSYCINNPLKYSDPTGDFFWIIPNISFSPNGGLNFDITFGVGIPGVFGGQLTVGGGAGGFNVSAGGFAGPASAYVGYSKNGGFMAGAGLGFGGLPNGFNTNMTGIGVNYSSNGGLNFNISSAQFDTHGNMSIDPSIGYSQMVYSSGSSISEISSAGLGVVGKEIAEIGTNAQKDAFLNRNGVDLCSLGVQSVEMENTEFPKSMKKEGYKRWEDGVIAKGPRPIGGVTYSEGGWIPKSTIYMSPFNTERNFTISLNHEFIHAWQWKSFGSRMSKSAWDAYADPSAYSNTNMYFPSFEKQILYNGLLNPYNWPSNLINVR